MVPRGTKKESLDKSKLSLSFADVATLTLPQHYCLVEVPFR